MLALNEEWDNFCDALENTSIIQLTGGKASYMAATDVNYTKPAPVPVPAPAPASNINNPLVPPKCSSLYISTKTKIAYLNKPIDLKTVFWKIPLISYSLPQIGVIKKQMKFNSVSQSDLDLVLEETAKYNHYDEYIISQNTPDSRNKFTDIRKMSFGLCHKDITSYHRKKKGAFYNCFVMILRLYQAERDKYKEIHVKVFNTGKLEIPGIQNPETLQQTLTLLTDVLRPLVDEGIPVLQFLEHKSETVLINSNFSCGYFINRDKLYSKLKYTYKINSAYDPCSYPGIQCEFYYDPVLKVQTGMQPIDGLAARITRISFMIFRTGSVLIVGKCTEEILYEIYDFLCHMFHTEFSEVNGGLIVPLSAEETMVKKERKIRRKIF